VVANAAPHGLPTAEVRLAAAQKDALVRLLRSRPRYPWLAEMLAMLGAQAQGIVELAEYA
jgi:hypothetical protein